MLRRGEGSPMRQETGNEIPGVGGLKGRKEGGGKEKTNKTNCHLKMP